MDRKEVSLIIDGSAGLTLVEVLIALVVLTVGILALARILPAGSRSELAARMQTVGCQYANETFEKVRTLPRTDPALSLGRHPATGFDTLQTSWRRCYFVAQMPSPLDSLLQVETTVVWRSTRPDSIKLTSYVMP